MIDLARARVLVTGGSGFLGRHLVARLRDAGCGEVIAPRRSEYDLRHEKDVARLFTASAPHVVIHAAGAVGGIGANRAAPGQFFYDNLLMGILTLEYSRRHAVRKYVAIGTICAYPKHTPVPFREEDLWNGYPEETNAPYGLAKKMLLVQGEAYRRQYGFTSIHLLPANLYGPGDNFDPSTSHVIPALIRRFVESRDAGRPTVEVWGDGNATRDFLYVDDGARAIAIAAEEYDGEAPVNIGTGVEWSIRQVAERIAMLTGFEGRIVWNPSEPNGQPRRCLDVSRAAEAFGFRAEVPFADGLARTVAWYEQTRAGSAAGRDGPGSGVA